MITMKCMDMLKVKGHSDEADGSVRGESNLWDAQPVVSQLHGFSGILHWFHWIPGLPVGTQACKQHAQQHCQLQQRTETQQLRKYCNNEIQQTTKFNVWVSAQWKSDFFKRDDFYERDLWHSLEAFSAETLRMDFTVKFCRRRPVSRCDTLEMTRICILEFSKKSWVNVNSRRKNWSESKWYILFIQKNV